MTEIALSNLVAWSVQVGMLTLMAVVVTRIVQVDAPAVRYAWWRAVLVVCLLLPVIQPWQRPVLVTTEVLPVDWTAPASPGPAARAAPVQAPAVARVTGPGWPSILAAVLVAGALLRLTLLGAGLVRLRRLRSAGGP